MRFRFFLIGLMLLVTTFCLGQQKAIVFLIMNNGERLMLETKLRSSSDGSVIPSDPDSYYFKCKGPSGKVEIRKSEVDSIIVGATVYERRKFEGKDIFGFFVTRGNIDVFKYYDYGTKETIGFNGVPTQSLNKVIQTTLLLKEGNFFERILWPDYLNDLGIECHEFEKYYKKVKKKWKTENIEKSLLHYNLNCI